MEIERVVRIVCGLVGTAEAEQVRRDGAMAGTGEDRDHPAIQVAPGGLAVQAEEDLLGLPRALIHVMRAQVREAWKVLQVALSERKAGQISKSRVGCSQNGIHKPIV